LLLLVLHSEQSLGKNRLVLIRQSLKMDAGLPNATLGVEKVRLDEINEGHGLSRIGLEVLENGPPTAIEFYQIGIRGDALNPYVRNDWHKGVDRLTRQICKYGYESHGKEGQPYQY